MIALTKETDYSIEIIAAKYQYQKRGMEILEGSDYDDEGKSKETSVYVGWLMDKAIIKLHKTTGKSRLFVRKRLLKYGALALLQRIQTEFPKYEDIYESIEFTEDRQIITHLKQRDEILERHSDPVHIHITMSTEMEGIITECLEVLRGSRRATIALSFSLALITFENIFPDHVTQIFENDLEELEKRLMWEKMLYDVIQKGNRG